MKYFYRFSVAATTAALLFSSSFSAFAEDREKISSVSLTIEADYDEDEHDSIKDMDLEVYTDDDTYSVDDYEVTGTSSSHPVIEVTLVAEDDYYFSVSNDDIDLDGEDGTVTSKSTKNSKETLVLKIRLSDISTDDDDDDDDDDDSELGSVKLASDGIGSWDEDDDAKKYEVRFYRGGSTVGSTITTKNTEYYFGSMITQNGNYSFKVRSIDTDDKKSDWIESNSRYFSYDPDSTSPEKFTDGNSSSSDDKNSSNDSNSGTPGSSNDSNTSNTSGSSGWQVDNIGWWYLNGDGSYPAGEWKFIDENWYHFGPNGYMQTGWISDNGRTYYLNTVNDSTLGRMVIGWCWIGDKCYYFNPASDGTKGALLTNTVVEGQYRLGTDGALIQ